jgi:hypothetical protein
MIQLSTNSSEKKKVLLKLENKPSCHSKDLEERRLGTVLGSYTRKTSNSYDPEFDKLIRKTKPHWFIDTTAENKKELLKLEDRPSCAAKDTEEKMSGLQLSRYTNPNSGCYDPEFDKLIRKAKPEWFVNTAAKNK